MKSNKTVAVAMSGGVDSSVAALLLKEQGFNVIGFTGKMQNTEAFNKVVENAKIVADSIGIEHYAVDLSDEFKKLVIEYFEETYKQGLTPNPCAICNGAIKWGKLRDYVKEQINPDYFATGHYASIVKENNTYKVYRAKDDKKDQIYMLFNLKQSDLAQTLFPLSGYKKDEIRDIALKHNLPCATSKDSQDVCFIPKPDTAKKYLIRKFKEQKGDIRDINSNKKLGEHSGFYQYTIGQRKGIGIAAPNPLYVIKLDAKTNTVFVGEIKDLEQSIVNVHRFNWQQMEYQNGEFEALVKIRYNTCAKPAIIKPLDNNLAQIKLIEPELGVSPGQACVIYDRQNEFLIGGGFIV